MKTLKKIKPLLCCLVVFMTILVCSLVFVGCNKKHEHKVESWTITKQATCTEEGLRVGKCAKCDEELTETIEKLPHDYSAWTIDYAASCSAEGQQTHSCKTCGYVEHETINKLPHVPLTIAGSEPTCTEPGKTDGSVCMECGQTLVAQQTIAATGHSFTQWQTITPADCEIPGEDFRSCTKCTHQETRQLPALTHDYSTCRPKEGAVGTHILVCSHNEQHTLEVACTFTTEQVVEQTCKGRGYTLERCAECHATQEINQKDPLDHLYNGANEGWVAVTQDCEDGSHTHQHYRLCARCGDTTEPTDCELTLQRTVDETCTTAGYQEKKCTLCGSIHEEIDPDKPAKGHTWVWEKAQYNNIQSRHWQRCTTCQTTTISEQCNLIIERHDATCESGSYIHYSCPICEQAFDLQGSVGKLGHELEYEFNGDKANPTHHVKCKRCDYEVESQPCEMAQSGQKLPTCTSDGEITKICKYCLEKVTENGLEASGHNWQWTELSDTTHTRYCDRCKTTETHAHNFELIKHNPATCNSIESYERRCLECQKEVTEYGDGSYGHVWVVDEVYADRHVRHCENCEEIDSSAHDWSECNLCSACQVDALDYKIEGKHCIVLNKQKLKCPNIIIPQFHKVLDGQGGWEANQYEVTEIGDSAFRFFANDNIYTRTVVIPSSVERIGSSAFLYCRALKSFTIEGDNSSLKYINSNAFSGCFMLEEFETPSTLISVDAHAFANCTMLTKIDFKSGDNIEFIGSHAFLNTGYANNPDNWKYVVEGQTYTDALYIGKHLIYARQVGEQTTFTLRDGTTSIAASAFDQFPNLTKVVLKPSLKIVDKDAFKACTKLTEVEFTGTVEQWFEIEFMNDYASPLYHGNTGLHIDDADGIIDLSNKTFTRLPAGTFRNDKNITKVILPATLTEIGEEAFEGCTSLTKIEFKGDKVRAVGVNAFKDSGVYTFVDGAVYVDYILVKVAADKSGAFTIKAGTLTVADQALKDCTSVTSITIASSLQYVGVEAFAGCTSVTSLTFEDNTYSWLIFMKDSIGRAYSNGALAWSNLKNFTGFWIRIEKAA